MTVESKIVEGCIAGKRKSQNQLYKRYASTMLVVCLRYSSNVAEAEDILHDGFIKVFKNINSYRQDGSFEGWIRRIMVNTAITHFNKRKKAKFLEEDISKYEWQMVEEEQTSESYKSVEPKVVMDIIQQLPEGYRIVLNLYAFEGYTHKEIAEILNVSESTSKTQLFKARKKIRQRLIEINAVNFSEIPNERTV
jgi:RNA polymerase sigma-70 factor (ECF subfamily)